MMKYTCDIPEYEGKRIELSDLNTKWLGKSFIDFDEVDSTNSWLMRRGMELPHGQVCAALTQSSGKGRLGRRWSDRKGAGLAMSFLLHDFSPDNMQALPLLAGLAAARAVEDLTGESALVKWSNDILLNEKKICGILCESRISQDKSLCVTGLGVNLDYTRQELDALNLVYAASIKSETSKNVDRLSMAAAILNNMEILLDSGGFPAFRQEYASRCYTLGKEVILIDRDNTERRGKALDISEAGDLICSVNGRLEHIRAGEVSVRGLYGYV